MLRSRRVLLPVAFPSVAMERALPSWPARDSGVYHRYDWAVEEGPMGVGEPQNQITERDRALVLRELELPDSVVHGVFLR